MKVTPVFLTGICGRSNFPAPAQPIHWPHWETDESITRSYVFVRIASTGAMFMPIGRDCNRHQVKIAVPNATPGDDLIGKSPYPIERTTQYAGLEAVIMIKMHVQCGHAQVVVLVLGFSQPGRQIAAVMIVDIGENADAIPVRILLTSLPGKKAAQQIAHGLRTAGIAESPAVSFESLGKFPVERYREAFGHGQGLLSEQLDRGPGAPG